MEAFRDSTLVLLTAPFYVVLILAEIVWSRLHGVQTYSVRGTLANFVMAAINVALDLLLRGTWLVVLMAIYQARVVDVAYFGWAYWVVLVLAQDLLFYFFHRVDHCCRLMWAVHVTHHSSDEFNLTVGVRPSVLQPLYRFVWFLPLSWLGARPGDVLLMYSLTQMYGVLVHTRCVGRLGPLEWLMVTPSNHRVHHGSNPQYLDKNFGMLLIIWDRLFGTFQPETEEARFGLHEQPSQTGRPIQAITSEWVAITRDLRRAKGLTARLLAIFGPPRSTPGPHHE